MRFLCAASAAHFCFSGGAFMKKLALIFAFLLLLCGCVPKRPPKDYPTERMEKALDSAEFHLASSYFSYSGLVAFLEKSGYSPEEAAFAAENCGADWFEQAAKCAKELLEFSSFTKEALVFQLEIKGFTHEEALFGAEQNGY
ncbi:MAG: hypothetical protein E7489_04100 [Ruminococcaceae bacterium]|nr:hypothetical protein [Oscillospiraceae bacterium]